MATEALHRIATIYRVAPGLAELAGEERLRMRQTVTKPLWEKLHVWLQLERARVLDGGATAKALNYRLNAWDTLTRYIDDGQLPIDTDVFVPCPLSKVAVDHGQFSGQPIGLVVMVQGHVHLIDLLGGHPRLGQELRGV